jgi:PleD family two-component response regulator
MGRPEVTPPPIHHTLERGIHTGLPLKITGILTRKLSCQASHDTLTGLFNRYEFENRLKEALELARTEGSQITLCYMDLDQFKLVNDTGGHIAGDELLRQLSHMTALRCGLCAGLRHCQTCSAGEPV